MNPQMPVATNMTASTDDDPDLVAEAAPSHDGRERVVEPNPEEIGEAVHEVRSHPDRLGNRLAGQGLMINVVIPILILLAGVGVVRVLGSVEPKARQPDDQTLLGRMRRLPPADVVQVRSLQEIGKPLELVVDGVVVPHQEVQIAAEVSGRVIEKSPLCRAGNYVTEGQLLVRIDPTDYLQEVTRLTFAQEQDYQALREVEQEIVNARRTLEIVRKDVELAEGEANRLRRLPTGFVSEGELDQAQKAVLASQQNELAVNNQISLLESRRGRLEASRGLATAQLKTAQINLDRCEIRSPANGVIVREDAELNSFLTRGAPIITLEDISKAEVAVNLRMDQLYWVLDQGSERLSPGQNDSEVFEAIRRVGYSLPPTPAVVEYQITGLAGRTFRWAGTLVRYDGIGMDTRSRTVPVKVVVDSPDQVIAEVGQSPLAASPSALVRGMFVRVRLQIQPQTPLVVIPAVAMRPGNRVWQFVEDAGVLESGTSGEAGAEAELAQGSQTLTSATGADADGDGDGQPGEPTAPNAEPAASGGAVVEGSDFEPRDWVAGRVVILADIAPIDTLRLGEWSGEAPQETDPAGRPVRRFWVCAVPENSLVGGDWLITSPLGDLGIAAGDTGYPVRVKRTEMQP